jgi:protein TonB
MQQFMPATRQSVVRRKDAKSVLWAEPVPGVESHVEPKVVRAPVRIFSGIDDEEDNRTFFQRYGVAIGVLTVVAIVIVFTIRMIAGAGSSPRKESALVLVSLPPPPPPPPVQNVPPEPKMEDRQTFQPEEKPEEEPPKPPNEPPIGTNIKGDGTANPFGLGNTAGSGFGDRAASASRFGWYAGQVQSKISEALRNNRKTHVAELNIRARIWPDASGRITRAQLTGSTGDPSLDTAIQDEVLTGLQLREPPPAGMPMPIVLQLTAKRPH